MTAIASSDPQPRLFLRRGLALLFDLLLSGILAGFIVTLISLTVGRDLGAPDFVRVSECAPAPAGHELAEEIERLWPTEAGAVRRNWLCETSLLGLAGRQSLVSVMTREGEDQAREQEAASRAVTVEIGTDGAAMKPMPATDLSLLFIVPIMAFFLSGGKRSPGMAMMQLSIRRHGGGALDYRRALLRETLLLVPLIVAFLVSFWFDLLPYAMGKTPTLAELVAQARAAAPKTFPADYLRMLALGLFALLWWVLPFAIWRGRTWYDGIVDAEVVRTK